MAQVQSPLVGSARWALALGMTLLAIGGFGFFQLTRSYKARIDQARMPVAAISVIVAARDLHQGLAITQDDLFEIDIAPKYIPRGVLTSASHALGRMPRERILANEFLRTERLADVQRGAGLNAIIPRGMRAISVNVAHAQGGAGFVSPEDYVDVLLTMTDPHTEASTTTLVMEAVYVLAVDEWSAGATADDFHEGEMLDRVRQLRLQPSVTFAVTPVQAEHLAYAARQGQLQVMMRNGLDATGVGPDRQTVTLDSLFVEPPDIDAPRVGRDSRACEQIRIYRGDQVTYEAWGGGACL